MVPAYFLISAKNQRIKQVNKIKKVQTSKKNTNLINLSVFVAALIMIFCFRQVMDSLSNSALSGDINRDYIYSLIKNSKTSSLKSIFLKSGISRLGNFQVSEFARAISNKKTFKKILESDNSIFQKDIDLLNIMEVSKFTSKEISQTLELIHMRYILEAFNKEIGFTFSEKFERNNMIQADLETEANIESQIKLENLINQSPKSKNMSQFLENNSKINFIYLVAYEIFKKSQLRINEINLLKLSSKLDSIAINHIIDLDQKYSIECIKFLSFIQDKNFLPSSFGSRIGEYVQDIAKKFIGEKIDFTIKNFNSNKNIHYINDKPYEGIDVKVNHAPIDDWKEYKPNKLNSVVDKSNEACRKAELEFYKANSAIDKIEFEANIPSYDNDLLSDQGKNIIHKDEDQTEKLKEQLIRIINSQVPLAIESKLSLATVAERKKHNNMYLSNSFVNEVSKIHIEQNTGKILFQIPGGIYTNSPQGNMMIIEYLLKKIQIL